MRNERLQEELKLLRPLPGKRLEDHRHLTVRVTRASTITAAGKIYSVPGRLIGELLDVTLYGNRLELRYAQKLVETLPRMRGNNEHYVQYRHVIEELERKPGAFENYRYREEMFPTSRFRMAYDELKQNTPRKAEREYIAILKMAATESETAVDAALTVLFNESREINAASVRKLLNENIQPVQPNNLQIDAVDLNLYDRLLEIKPVMYLNKNIASEENNHV